MSQGVGSHGNRQRNWLCNGGLGSCLSILTDSDMILYSRDARKRFCGASNGSLDDTFGLLLEKPDRFQLFFELSSFYVCVCVCWWGLVVGITRSPSSGEVTKAGKTICSLAPRAGSYRPRLLTLVCYARMLRVYPSNAGQNNLELLLKNTFSAHR